MIFKQQNLRPACAYMHRLVRGFAVFAHNLWTSRYLPGHNEGLGLNVRVPRLCCVFTDHKYSKYPFVCSSLSLIIEDIKYLFLNCL